MTNSYVAKTVNRHKLLGSAESYDDWTDSMPGVSNILNGAYQWFSGPVTDFSMISVDVDFTAHPLVLVEAWWDMSRDAGPQLTTLEMQVWDVTDEEVVLYAHQTRNATQDFQGGEQTSKVYRAASGGVHELRFHMKCPGAAIHIKGQRSTDGTSTGYLAGFDQSFGLRVWKAGV